MRFNVVISIPALLVLSVTLNAQQQPVYLSYSITEQGKTDMITDTLYLEHFERDHVLIGTTVLVGSEKNKVSVAYGYGLYKIILTPCEGPVNEERGSDMITNIASTDSTLLVDAKVYSTCGHDFLCEVEVLLEDSTINLISTGYGSYAICSCCFGLRYEVHRPQGMGEFPMRYVMINGDRNSRKRIIE